MSAPLPRMLLTQAQFVLRRTVVMVARDLGLVDFDEASNVGRARQLLSAGAYAGLVLDLQDRSLAMELLSDLRQGKFACPADIPVVVLAADLHPEDCSRLETLGVARVLRKPVRIRDLFNALELQA
ncbi:MAG: response regulator [Comamonas sp.]